MKRCPECRRDYFDDSLSFCLDDGTALLDGPNDSTEKRTAVLPSADVLAQLPTQKYKAREKIEGSSRVPARKSSASSNREAWKSWTAGILVASVVALLGVGIYLYNGREQPAAQIESLAILPFENEGHNPDLEYLSDGITEALINRLSQLAGLKVIARSSAYKYKGTGSDPYEIAKVLGVQAIVTGRVVNRGESLSISVEMMDARDASHMWGQNYERSSHDLLVVQSEISRDISQKLRQRLTPGEKQQLSNQGTTSQEAYEPFLKARFFWQKTGRENQLKAVDFYKQAIAADPSFALAHAELSVRYSNLAANSILDPKEFSPKAEIELLKALALDDSLPDAHLALANFKLNAWEWAPAETEYKRAIQLNPNFSEAHRWYANFLGAMGRHDEAIAEINHARALDPISLPANADVGFTLYLARRYDEALVSLENTRALDPTYSLTYNYLGYTYSEMGKYAEAISAYEEAVKKGADGSSNQIYLAAAFAKSGDRARADAILNRVLTSGEYASPVELATLYAALDEREKAITSLEKAFAARDLQLQYLAVDPTLDTLHDDPRFKDLVRRVGLPV